MDNWSNEFIINSEAKDRLIISVGKDKGNQIICLGRI